MKRMFFVISTAFCIHAVNAMEASKLGIEPIDYSTIRNITKLPEYACVDEALGLKEFDTTIPYYLFPEIVKDVFGLEQPKVVPSGNDNFDSLCNILAGNIHLTKNGEYNFYFFIHELHKNWSLLKKLIKGIEPKDTSTDKKSQKSSSFSKQPMPVGPQTSGLGLAWIFPTLRYTTAVLCGAGALKLYQLYRAR